jgi:YesN/AraC family two-component response regulator
MLAGNGAEGLDKASQHLPDLIISDVMMPVMDGVELCRKIKEDEVTSHIPVILLTAKADIESRLEGLETGADDYMTKPFDARELQTRVKNLIRQRENLRSRFSRTVILRPKEIAITSRDETFLERVMAIVESNLSNSEFTMEDFQRDVGMSRMQLHRKLKALTGHSAGEFMRIQRLIRASELLSKTNGNVTEVCYQTGFTSVSYFSKCFKKQFGVLPKAFASKDPV